MTLGNITPPSDVTLFATKASLVVRRDLHSAIQYLPLNTAVRIHSGVGMFHRAGRFPAAEGIDLPLSDQAIQFYKSGLPFLQNNLPFWMASLVGRLLRCAHSDRRSAVPNGAIVAGTLQLADAVKDRATVRWT